MGEGLSRVAVADAGPLIHLYEIRRLQLLSIAFTSILVPQAVCDEAIAAGRMSELELIEAAKLQRYAVTPEQLAQTAALPEAAGLHRGELECLALCRATSTNLLLTDDLAARDAAKRLGLLPVGSLGVIIKVYHGSHLSLQDAEQAIQDLHIASSLFVTSAIVELAIAALRTLKP